MCRSAWHSVFVIAKNVLRRPVVKNRHRSPALADIGQVLQQGGLAGMTADPTQSLLNGAFGRRRDVLVGELSEISASRSVSGSLMLRAIGRVPWFLNRYLLASGLRKGIRRSSFEAASLGWIGGRGVNRGGFKKLRFF
jgi:hypothetical protein